MKKVFIILLALFVGEMMVHAQGYDSISEVFSGGGLIETNTSDFYTQNSGIYATGLMAPASSGQQYNFAMLVASNTNSSDETPLGSDWSLETIDGTSTPVFATNSAIAGSPEGPGGTKGFEVPNWFPGTSMYVMLVGWSANLGDWNQIQVDLGDDFAGNDIAGFVGFSDIGSVTAGEPPPGDPGDVTLSMPAFDLFAVPVPEPAAIALVGLGSLAMLFHGRGKIQSRS